MTDYTRLNDFRDYKLYPTVYNQADSVFSGFGLVFKKNGSKWQSATYINGTSHKRAEKTVIGATLPVIKEQGGVGYQFVNYVKMRNSCGYMEAIRFLAEKVGLGDELKQLEKEVFSNGDYTNYEHQQKSKEAEYQAYEACNEFAVHALRCVINNDLSKLKTLGYSDEDIEKLKGVRQYLQTREYSDEDIEAMELGGIVNKELLEQFLQKKSFEPEVTKQLLEILEDDRIFAKNNLSIPYRTNCKIRGFAFRAVVDKTQPKYLYGKGLVKTDSFFNISNVSIYHNKHLIIVEGVLDALHASIVGIQNVVAIGSNKVSEEQLKDAVKRGARSFTLCLDYEPDKVTETNGNIDRVIKIFKGQAKNHQDLQLKIANLSSLNLDLETLGTSKLDLDLAIKEYKTSKISGYVEILKKHLIEEAPLYCFWQTEALFLRVEPRIHQDGIHTGVIDDIILELKEIEKDISTVNQCLVSKYAEELFKRCGVDIPLEVIKQTITVSETELETEIKKLKSTDNIKIKGLEAEITKDMEAGGTLTTIDKKFEEIQNIEAVTDNNYKLKAEVIIKLSKGDRRGAEESYRQVKMTTIDVTDMSLKPLDVLLNLQENNTGYSTGYTALNELGVSYKAGRMTIIAGNTGHGKTAYMLNALLNMSNAQPNKTFYLLNYEGVTKDELYLRLLTLQINHDFITDSHYRHIIDKLPDYNQGNNMAFVRYVLSTEKVQYAKRLLGCATEAQASEELKKEQDIILNGLGNIKDRKIRIIDAHKYTLEQLPTLFEVLNRDSDDLGAIFVDYAQRIPVTEERKDKIRGKTVDVSDGLMRLARLSNVPLIVGCQVNNPLGDVPTTDNVKESKNLSEDADTVLGLVNFTRNEKQEFVNHKLLDKYTSTRYSVLHFHVAKNRGGKAGDVAQLAFWEGTGKITDLAKANWRTQYSELLYKNKNTSQVETKNGGGEKDIVVAGDMVLIQGVRYLIEQTGINKGKVKYESEYYTVEQLKKNITI
jgi:replicative DNA helicase